MGAIDHHVGRGAQHLEAAVPADGCEPLDVSVLDEFTSELCDEIRGASDSLQLLGRCRTANLFVIDLDKTGTSCRLHALFAQLLRARLAAHDAERLSALHARASNARSILDHPFVTWPTLEAATA